MKLKFMAKEAIDFAEKHRVNLLRDKKNGYFIQDKYTRQIVDTAYNNTAKSAIKMMKRYIEIPEDLR